MKKALLAVVVATVVALGSAAAQKANAPKPTGKVTCTLTNTTSDKCCCIEQKDGKLYCTLAKKTVDPCCCKPADK